MWVKWISKRQSTNMTLMTERGNNMVRPGNCFPVNSQNITDRRKNCFGKTLCIMRVWNAFYRISSPEGS